MRINKQKRIGNILIIVEGEVTEFEVLEDIFNKFLNYSITKTKRNSIDVVELEGEDRYSKVNLVNAPTNNINCLKDQNQFYNYLYENYALKLGIDTTNDPVYIVFDRDHKNNRYAITKKLLSCLNQSQNDTDEQNGLLLLSYPSIESFVLSMNIKDSCNTMVELGKELKSLPILKTCDKNITEDSLQIARNEFLTFLTQSNIIKKDSEVISKSEELGLNIFDFQEAQFLKTKKYHCISQLVQILIDLGIIEI